MHSQVDVRVLGAVVAQGGALHAGGGTAVRRLADGVGKRRPARRLPPGQGVPVGAGGSAGGSRAFCAAGLLEFEQSRLASRLQRLR